MKKSELRQIIREELQNLNEAKTFYAFWKVDKHEIEADSLCDAKKKAIKQLKVPKSKEGMLAVKSADSMKKGDFRFEMKEEANLLNEMNLEDSQVMRVISDNVRHTHKKGGSVRVVIKRKSVSVSLYVDDEGEPDPDLLPQDAEVIHRFHATLGSEGKWKIIQTNGITYTNKKTLSDDKAAALVRAIFNLIN